MADQERGVLLGLVAFVGEVQQDQELFAGLAFLEG